MALVKCKECGEKVSNKAKSCPKCGAAAPKKTSLVTWLVLILIIFGVYGAMQTPSTSSSSSTSSNASSTSSSSSSSQKQRIAVKTPVKPKWQHTTSTDKMTGILSAYAASPTVAAATGMSFPYSDVKAWLGVGCDGENEWVYIGFNSAPNLANTETKDGYNLISTRIKWNDSVQNISLTQDWGAKFIHFQNDQAAINKIVSSNTALLELQWHGEQPTYFEFSLNGSSAALKAIRSACSK